MSGLGDNDSLVRVATLQILIQLGAPRAIELIAVTLHDKDRDVRRVAVETLAKLGHPRAVELLIATLHDKDRDVRRVAVETLAKLGKPPFWRLPYGEPVWVEVPAGEFTMGSEMEDDEKPIHRVYLDRFLIARVPVTNAQYRFFVEATGREPPECWEKGCPPKGKASHPVVHVNWHDAMAYCVWLGEVTGKPVSLPSEVQWEKAARGDQDRRAYPWGDEWDESKCNSRELDVGDKVSVGVFPEGQSPYGCLDMAGNVWEWTRSLYESYPYDPDDGRESVEASHHLPRVLRGGSFYSVRGRVRCAVRHRVNPYYGYDFYGFRLVSPISLP